MSDKEYNLLLDLIGITFIINIIISLFLCTIVITDILIR